VIPTGDELVAPRRGPAPRTGRNLRRQRAIHRRCGPGRRRRASGVIPTVGDDTAEMKRVLADAAAECDLVMTSAPPALARWTSLGGHRGRRRATAPRRRPSSPANRRSWPVSPGRRSSASPATGCRRSRCSGRSSRPRFGKRRAVRRWSGPSGELRLSEDVHYDEGRHRLLPVGLVTDGAGGTFAYPVDKGSGATTTLTNADGIVEMATETSLLEADEAVTVDLFGTDVRPPRLFGVGEADPALWTPARRRPRTLFPGRRVG